MDCHLRYAHLCLVQREFEEFCIVLSRPCNYPQVVLAESLPPPHMRGITASWSAFVPKIFDETHKKCYEICCGTFPVFNTPLPFDHTCCLCKSELETCLRKLQSESSFLFLLPISSTSMVSTNTSDLRQHALLVGWFLIFFVSHFDICTKILQLVRCHLRLVLHLDSEFSWDLRAHCPTITVSPIADNSSLDDDQRRSHCWPLSISLLGSRGN